MDIYNNLKLLRKRQYNTLGVASESRGGARGKCPWRYISGLNKTVRNQSRCSPCPCS